MTFKKLVKAISECKNEEHLWEIRGRIDRAFSADKINWNDHVILFNIIDMIETDPTCYEIPEE